MTMKKVISLVLACLLLACLFAGCTKTKTGVNGKANPLFEGYSLTDGVIVIDGVLYQSFKDPYSKFSGNGWTTDWNTSVEAKTAVIGGASLTSDKYPLAKVHVSFYNPSDETASVKNCNILGIEVDGMNYDATYEKDKEHPSSCYDFELPGGIRRGSTADEIKAAYGKPASSDSDTDPIKCQFLSYEGDGVTVVLCVYDEYGLQRVEIIDNRWKNAN